MVVSIRKCPYDKGQAMVKHISSILNSLHNSGQQTNMLKDTSHVKTDAHRASQPQITQDKFCT